jgi:hypothetical protein
MNTLTLEQATYIAELIDGEGLLLALRNKSLDAALPNIYSIVIFGNTNVRLLNWLKDVTDVGQTYTLNGTESKRYTFSRRGLR